VKPRAAGSGIAYLPQQFRDLPFVPPVPSSATPGCDSSFPDVFRTVHTNALVTRISTCPFQIKATIPVVTRPLQVAITPDGSTALVTSFDNAVNFINLSTNKVSFTLNTDPSINPDGIAISSDGTRAYVTSFNTDNPVVMVIDLTSNTLITTIKTIPYAQGVTLTPDGAQLWITSPLGASTDVIDTLSNTEIINIGVPQSTGIAFNSTGTRAYITSQVSAPGTVVVVDTATFKVLNTYTVGSGPTDIAMSYGDQFLVVNNFGDGTTSVIDLIKNAVVTANVGASPSGIAFVH
jgi:YVTN family beta-propeller protein